MSIWASSWSADATEHDDGCGMWTDLGPTTHYRPVEGWLRISYATDGHTYGLDTTRPCTCNAGPIAYHASHIYPDQKDRGGIVDIAVLPAHIHDWYTGPNRPRVDAVRLWVTMPQAEADAHYRGDAACILDRDQVTSMVAFLTDWLNNERDPA